MFCLIWVDENSKNNSPDTKKIIEQLQNTAKNLELFVRIDESLKFLDDNKNKNVIIVTSGSMGRTLVPQVHSLKNVSSILIYCGIKANHEAWAKNWEKIVAVETEIEKICSKIRPLFVECSSSEEKFLFASNWKSLDLDFSLFVILKEIFSKMKSENDDCTDFVRNGWTIYKNDVETMKNLEEFRSNFQREKAFYWFRSTNFVKPLLEKAFNQFDMKLLLDSRFFINALDENISRFDRKLCVHGKSFYSFEFFSPEKFAQISSKEKNLILWKNFLEAKNEYSVWPQKKDGQISVLLKIDVPLTNSDEKFGSPSSSEIIFSFGSVFRIEKVQIIETNSRAQIDLILMKNDFVDATAIEFPDAFGLVRIGRKFLDFGKIEEAERFYEILLENSGLESQRTFYFYHLARIKSFLGKNEQAIALLEKAIERNKEMLCDELENIPVLAQLSFLHEQNKNLEKSFFYQKEMFRIRRYSLPDNDPIFVENLQSLAKSSDKLGDFNGALRFYFDALKLQEKILPENHPDLVFSFSSIAKTFEKLQQFAEAKKFYEKALRIKSKTLPPSHPSLLEDYDCLSAISLKLNNLDEAKIFFDKSISLRRQNSQNANDKIDSLSL